MAKEKCIADALNSLTKSNIRGHVDEHQLHELVTDYFGGTDDVDSKLSESDSKPESDAGVGEEEEPSDDDDYQDIDNDDRNEGEGLVVTDQIQSILGPAGIKVPEALHEDNEEELKRIRSFSCQCRHYNDGPCIKQFSPEFLLKRRVDMQSLTEGEIVACFQSLLVPSIYSHSGEFYWSTVSLPHRSMTLLLKL